MKTLEDIENATWPEKEDTYEYKLVGINVHSGTANAGHYWSYINTTRDPWRAAYADKWMEFNDTHVQSWNYLQEVETRCFGNKGSRGFDVAGDSGTSAYMLFYERVDRFKKNDRMEQTNKSFRVVLP